jgi:hypothetical protein
MLSIASITLRHGATVNDETSQIQQETRLKNSGTPVTSLAVVVACSKHGQESISHLKAVRYNSSSVSIECEDRTNLGAGEQAAAAGVVVAHVVNDASYFAAGGLNTFGI